MGGTGSGGAAGQAAGEDRAPRPAAKPLKRSLHGAGRPAAAMDVDPAPARLPSTPTARLKYAVHGFSSYAAAYHPRHILHNKPGDQSSRWASATNNHNQFVTVRLDRMAVVQTITFGKFHKPHVCNLKEFKVYGGVSPEGMVELLHGGLRNDPEPETFSLKHKVDDVVFPCQFIKIVPLVSHGGNFNFSIWYLELRGIANPDIVKACHTQWISHRENQLYRLCLKHFRQRNFLEAFGALQSATQLQLEDPMLTELHRRLVIGGDFVGAEELIVKASEKNIFRDWIVSSPYQPMWKKVHPAGGCRGHLWKGRDGFGRFCPAGPDAPCQRGGHQMCIDVNESKLYLFGGFDGQRDLADLWMFDIASQRWTCLCPNTEAVGGPSARAVHKMVYDQATQQLYVLGRYVVPDANSSWDCDFWRYDVLTGQWFLISENTKNEGGPELIHDHQMVIDSENQMIYLFGGKIQGPSLASDTRYSGFYSYDITNNHWTLVFDDDSLGDGQVQLKGRSGHSMLFDPGMREIYIFAGQRQKECLADIYVYDIDNGVVHEVTRDFFKQGGPDPGFTDRSTIDQSAGEIYVLTGLLKEKTTSEEVVKSSFWVYNMHKEAWTKVYQNDNMGPETWTVAQDTEPCPRYAHQMAYDPVRKCQLLFGGNPGDPVNTSARLDDLWELWLLRPTMADIVRRCRFYIRRQHFRELCSSKDSFKALRYLQTEMNEVVDHTNEEEAREFQELTQHLFASPAGAGESGAGGMIGASKDKGRRRVGQPVEKEDPTAEAHRERTELYEKLLEFFPPSMKEPQEHLLDLLP
ncbi:Muskelin N-terminus-domain-containing protein [Hyaloraphidium curvatum]|nr:Muskelin N-terminus-domain-containing protein [Hyaloraphidium curvatum]